MFPASVALTLFLTVLSAGGCTITPPTTEDRRAEAVESAPPAPPSSLSIAAIERAVFEAANEARRQQGLAALGPDAALAQIARKHSARMATAGFFAHRDDLGQQPADRAQADGYDYRRFGENLFRGALWDTRTTRRSPLGEVSVAYNWHTPATLADEVVEGWLTSPSHRDNLLSPDYARMGIGVATDDESDVFVTQNLSLLRDGS
ncbi:MAG: CAP domain-containing protein [Bacteroidota bacterium]